MPDLSVQTPAGPYLTETGSSYSTSLAITLTAVSSPATYTFTPTGICALIVINNSGTEKIFTIVSEASTINLRKSDIAYTIASDEILTMFKFSKTDGWTNTTTGKISVTLPAGVSVAIVKVY